MKLSRNISVELDCINRQKQLVNQVNLKCIGDRACKNQPCECKLHEVIISLISLVLNTISHFCKSQEESPCNYENYENLELYSITI